MHAGDLAGKVGDGGDQGGPGGANVGRVVLGRVIPAARMEAQGLAAPQVGRPIRVVVIDCQDDHGLIELINPVITFREGTATDTEGCLSVPGIYGEVERAAKVKVEFLNRRGKKQHLTATGLLARCIQHELDHLEGQLFIDIAKSLHRGNQA